MPLVIAYARETAFSPRLERAAPEIRAVAGQVRRQIPRAPDEIARSEGLRLCRGPHLGRPASPIVAASNGAEALAGVLAALAGDFGVSEKFIAVRLSRYGLVEGGM
jgi:hypothetical protein